MVTAYDYDGRYVGCIGSETWQILLDGARLLTAEQVKQIEKDVRCIYLGDGTTEVLRAGRAYDRIIALLGGQR